MRSTLRHRRRVPLATAERYDPPQGDDRRVSCAEQRCSDPSLGRDEKAKGIREVLSSAKAHEVSMNAMSTLADGALGGCCQGD